MITLLLLALMAGAVTAPAAAPAATPAAAPAAAPAVEQDVTSRCDDLAVAGQVKNLPHEHVDTEDLEGTAIEDCEPPETKDRLSPEALEQMVEEPVAELRAHGLLAGQARFEHLRRLNEARHGPRSVRVADLIMAFGVQLYMEGMEDRGMLQASRDYLKAAIPAYRAAFGANHPEVAVALHSFADVEVAVSNYGLTPQAEAALEEALRIRRAALGPQHHETLATEARLASLREMVGTKPLPSNSVARALEEAEGSRRR